MQFIRILGIAWPILLAMFAQSAFTLIEMAFVGHFGKVASSALGLGAFFFTAVLAILVGISVGVQAYAAEFSGKNEPEKIDESLRAGIICSIVGGVLVMAASMLLAYPIFSVLTSNEDIVADATAYFLVKAIALPALAANGAFRGYFKGISKPGKYTFVLLIMLFLNIVLDWLLIFGNLGFPQMGLLGAALGFTIAAWVGIAIYLVYWLGPSKLASKSFGVSKSLLQAIVGRSIPAGVQQLIGVLSFPVLLSFMALVGTNALAAGTVLLNISFALILISQAFGFVAATLASEAIGIGKPASGKILSLQTSMIAVIFTSLFALPLVFIPDQTLSLFTSDEAVISEASTAARLIGIAMPIDAFGMVIMQTMLGVGQGKKVIVISLALQWAIAMPMSFLMGNILGYGMLGIWLPQIIARVLQSLLLGWYWFDGVMIFRSASMTNK